MALEIDRPLGTRPSASIGRVASVRPKGATKQLVTDTGVVLTVPRFAIAGMNEVLESDGRGTFIRTRNGKARLTPRYARDSFVALGGRRYAVTVKELDQDDELSAYVRLSDMHYRGERGFGRKGVLVAVASSPSLPRVLGYLEVTTGFLMNSPRTKILDTAYREGGVHWFGWGAQEMSSLTSLISRVSRVVVHPELRGQGIGTVLLENARRYARTHFHAGGYRPIFLEMTADMAKFVPFAESAGLRFIGYTEGNLHRVAKDMRYLMSRRDLLEMPTESLKARGIMQAQRRYASGIAGLPTGRSLDEVTAAASQVKPLDAATYADFHGVIRLPKPTYLCGLTRPSQQFVDRRAKDLAAVDPSRYEPEAVRTMTGGIEIRGLTVTVDSSVERTDRSSAVQEAFGIKPEAFRSVIISDLTVTIAPGAICLVYGPSGSGKSTFLNVLGGKVLPEAASVGGSVRLPGEARIACFADLPDDLPLIEVLAVEQSSAAAIHALNRAGLSDAKLYLRRYSELSNGQKYRAMLASLIASDANVWLADEFLSTLDPTTARIVATNVAAHVRATGVTLVVGAPHFGYFFEALAPDLIVELRSGWESRIYRGQEFARRHLAEDLVEE